MFCKQSKCCCCIPIKIGTYIIGGLHALYFVLFLTKSDWLGAALNLFSGSTFLAMVFRDTSFTRGAFFAAFATYVITVALLNLYFTFFLVGDDQAQFELAVRERCDEFEAQAGGFEKTQYDGIDDCIKQVKSASKRA